MDRGSLVIYSTYLILATAYNTRRRVEGKAVKEYTKKKKGKWDKIRRKNKKRNRRRRNRRKKIKKERRRVGKENEDETGMEKL
jgi:hypothetical protein